MPYFPGILSSQLSHRINAFKGMPFPVGSEDDYLAIKYHKVYTTFEAFMEMNLVLVNGVECLTSMKRTEGFHKWLLVILRFKVQVT